MVLLITIRRTLFANLLALFISVPLFAGRISGIITDPRGQPLPFASVLVKGTTIGTTANNEGHYFLQLEPGSYTIVAQYVGYGRVEKPVEVGDGITTLNFQLSLLDLSLKEVVVRPGAEDPAYEIIRNAIRKRPFYREQVPEFQCEVYTKGLLKLRDHPDKVLGQKVEFEDDDTSRKRILYLSETIATYSVQKPGRSRIEVLSSKVSGQSDAFGLSAPQIISFYDNNLQFGGLNPRGFISPIADNALSFYRYRFEGSFFEDGKEINRIRVIAKRKYEPVFTGYINITEGDWRIHSLQLLLTKQSQMQMLDTLRIEQLYTPYANDVWVIKTQVLYPAIKIFGFDAHGSFVNVYSKFDTDPAFGKKFFNSTLLKVNDGANKKPAEYWDTIRPLPLLTDEVRDYRKKDSLELRRKDPAVLDSMDRRNNRITMTNIILSGQSFIKRKNRTSFSINPLIQSVQFNPAEGWVVNLRGTWNKRIDSVNGRRAVSITPVIRYGFSNKHLNAYVNGSYTFATRYYSNLSITAGKRVFQFNNSNPISFMANTTASLFWRRNFAKTYEAWTARINYSKSIGEGVVLSGGFQYQDRLPLENTTDYAMVRNKDKQYSPNYPAELMSENFKRHQASQFNFGVNWRPGTRYIELPDRKIALGSKYPALSLTLNKAVSGFLGSDVDFTKWRFGISDDLNLKLGGNFRYNLVAGGFLQKDSVAVPDLIHFNGNQVFVRSQYLNSFQLLPYYKFSHSSRTFLEGHAEHHFNGLLTNKIPLFRRLNWHLVGAANAFYVNADSHYFEVSAGLENILRVIRFDIIWAFEHGRPSNAGIRIGVSGFISGADD